MFNGMRLDQCRHIHTAFCDNKSFESGESNDDYLRVLTQLSLSQAHILSLWYQSCGLCCLLFFMSNLILG